MLFNKLISPSFLHNAWRKLNKSNRHSHGISDETIEVFEQNLISRINQLSEFLKKKTFTFSDTRAAIIPKKGKSGFRPLQIPEVRDRLVLKALAILIEAEFEKLLKPCKSVSFAYQKNLSIKDASLAIRKAISQGNLFILEVDLVDFFGKIDKEFLIEKMILPQLSDQSINDILKVSLNQNISGLNKIKKEYRYLFESSKNGIPQGNPLSPLFSNIYLNSFDKRMIEENINLVRYADDFVILAKSKIEAEKALVICIEELEHNLKLEIHKTGKKKYKIIDLQKSNFEFLSIEHNLESFRPSKSSVEEILETIQREIKVGIKRGDLQHVLFKTKWILDGWVSAFYFSDISSHTIRMDAMINKFLYSAFERLGFSLNKKKLGKLPTKFRRTASNNYCISTDQRKNTGINLVEDIWKTKLE
jgi:RNA-directed DNA polymerase